MSPLSAPSSDTPLKVGLTRVAFGCQSFEDIARRQAMFMTHGTGETAEVYLTSARMPRQDLTGGSIFWILKHMLIARQPILGVAEATGPDGPMAIIRLKPGPIAVHPVPQRAHQGWRYIREDSWPRDIEQTGASETLPNDLVAELSRLHLF